MSSERTRRLAAVWFADIVGYTELSSRDEDGALSIVDELQRLSREAVESRGGRVVKFVGDGVLTVFDSTDAALKAALQLQETFSASEIVRAKGSALSIGVHVGEVVEAEDGDVYGDGVNLASRIEGAARPGQVVVSEDVYRQVRQRAEHGLGSIGTVTLKGLDEPLELFAIGEPVPTGTRPGSAPKQGFRYGRAMAVGLGAAIVGFFALGTFFAGSIPFLGSSSDRPLVVLGPVRGGLGTDSAYVGVEVVGEQVLRSITRARSLRSRTVDAVPMGNRFPPRVLPPPTEWGASLLIDIRARYVDGEYQFFVIFVDAASSEYVWTEDYLIPPDSLPVLAQKLASEVADSAISLATSLPGAN